MAITGIIGRGPVMVLMMLTIYSVLLFAVFQCLPEFEESDRADLKYPRTLDEVKKLGRLLSRYKDDNATVLLCGVLVIYVGLQSFAIPGSIFLTVLSGYLFAFPVALLLVCFCSSVGASVCYLFSLLLGREFVIRNWPQKVNYWQIEILKHKDHLINYIIFLRVTPFLPNWFINIASPVLNVPLSTFFLGTFIGVAPPSFLYIQAGSTLEQLTHTRVVWSWSSIFLLSFFAFLSVVPIIYERLSLKRKSKNK